MADPGPLRPVDHLFPARRNAIKQDKCVPAPAGCGGDAKTFTDEASRREYLISGLCQNCQDKVFR